VGYAGGYIAGGGHTTLAGLYGMAADNVLSIEVVTANGTFVTASSTSNPDLFWALRGGGGSTFGVVTSVTIRVFPKLPVTTSLFNYTTAAANTSNDVFWAGVRAYFAEMPRFVDAGTYSYFWIYNRTGVLSFEMRPFFAPNHTVDSFDVLTRPLFDKLRSLGIHPTPYTVAHPDYLSAFNSAWGANVAATVVGRTNSISGSRLFPRAIFESPARFDALMAALRRHSADGRMFGGYHLAPGTRAGARLADNAVNPAFRTAVAMLITMSAVPDNATPTQVGAASRHLEEGLARWRAVSPDGGSYGNEGHVMEPDWRASFYGDKYKRLLEVKRQWDPKGVFYATTGVGSEDWEVRDGDQGIQTQNGRLCRV
jgi:FAD/FMN-containing dehydrogenase